MRLFCLFLLFVPQFLGWAEEPDVFRVDVDPKKLRDVKERWFGMYVQGHKVGYMQVSTGPVMRDGVEVYQDVMVMQMQHKREGLTIERKMIERRWFEMASPFEMLGGETITQSGEDQQVVSLLRVDDEWQLTVEDSSGTRQLETDQIAYTLNDAMASEAWANQDDLEVNETIKIRTVDMESGATEFATLTFLGPDTYVTNGIRMPVRKLAMEKPGEPGRMLMYVDEQNDLLWLNLAGIEVRAEPKMAALQLDEAADFLGLTLKSIDKPLGDPKQMLELHVSVDDPALAKVAQTPQQKVELLADGSGAKFSLGQVSGPDLLASEDEIAEALKETHVHPIRSERVLALAKQAIGDAETAEQKVRALVGFVADYIEDSYVAEPLTVQGILEQRRGDCTEHALLFTTLARAVGIPARDVSGFIYAGDLSQGFGGHAWNEVVLDGKWHAVDASWNEFEINPAHIRLAAGADEAKLEALAAAFAKSSFKLDQVVYKSGYTPPHEQESGGGETVSLGKYGVRLKLANGWEKKPFSDEVELEQFRYGSSIMMMVFERLATYESEADFEPVIENIKQVGPGGNEIDNYVFKKRGDFYWGRVTTKTTLNGSALSYRADVLSKGGVTYQLVSWAPVPLASLHNGQMDELISGVMFPENLELPDADERKRLSIKSEVADVSVAYSEHEYTRLELEERQQVIFLVGKDSQSSVTIMIDEWVWENDPEKYMDASLVVMEFSDIEHVVRRQAFEIAGREGFLSVARGIVDRQKGWLYQIVAPLSANALMVYRGLFYAGAEEAGWQQALGMLDELEVDVHQAYSMPTMAEESAPAPFLNHLYNPYREAADVLFSMPAPDRVVAVGDQFVVAQGKALLLMAADGSQKLLKSYEEPITSLSAAAIKDEIYIQTNWENSVVQADGNVMSLDRMMDGVYSHSSEKAVIWQAKASNEAQILLDVFPTQVKFFDGKPAQKTQQVFAEDLHKMGVDGSGAHLLVVHEPAWHQTAEAAYYQSQCLDVTSGEMQPLGLNWRNVYRIVPADQGWVVFGRPENRPNGTYLVDLNGQTEMLLPGIAFFPVDLRAGRLRFYVDNHEHGQMLSADVAKVKAMTAANPMVDPAVSDKLARKALTALGWQLDQPGLLSKKTDILAFMQAADEVAKAELGAALPKDRDSIHQWLQFGYYSGVWWSLEAEVLMTAMLMRGFFEEGATWVDSDMSLIASFAKRMPDRYSAPLHLGFVAGGIFESTIHSEDGYWQPLAEIQEQAYGRSLVLCNDYKVLSDYIRGRTPQDMLAMALKKPKKFNKILDEHPQNTFLFFNAAENLIEMGEREALRKLLKYRKANWGAYEEHFALVLDVEEARQEPKDLLLRLTTQIEQYPNNALYRYLMGVTHLRVKGDDARPAARASFEKAQALSEESNPVYLKAEVALLKLDQ